MRSSGWAAVERCLRLRAPDGAELARALRSDGLWREALVLETPGLLDWALERVHAGQILTPMDETYPRRWLAALRSSAPAALWRQGQVPRMDFIAIVGSRNVGPSQSRFAWECAEEAIRLGHAVVSGGARGCDRAAALAAIRLDASGATLLEIVPVGTSELRVGCRLSYFAPGEEFSTAAAMERNALIYAASDLAIVVHARLKTGGAWHGAVDAHRRRLTRLCVRNDPSNPALRALAAIGAAPLSRAGDLESVLCSTQVLQASLPSLQ